jgi:hypothetical protein
MVMDAERRARLDHLCAKESRFSKFFRSESQETADDRQSRRTELIFQREKSFDPSSRRSRSQKGSSDKYMANGISDLECDWNRQLQVVIAASPRTSPRTCSCAGASPLGSPDAAMVIAAASLSTIGDEPSKEERWSAPDGD